MAYPKLLKIEAHFVIYYWNVFVQQFLWDFHLWHCCLLVYDMTCGNICLATRTRISHVLCANTPTHTHTIRGK